MIQMYKILSGKYDTALTPQGSSPFLHLARTRELPNPNPNTNPKPKPNPSPKKHSRLVPHHRLIESIAL